MITTIAPLASSQFPSLPLPLLIIGASARAAAFSALRAGFQPSCVDGFADSDLRAFCPAIAVGLDRLPEEIAKTLENGPAIPWIYLGGLENHPDFLEKLAHRQPLLGNQGEPLAKVRHPLVLSQIVQDAGLQFPDTRQTPEGLPTDGSWLAKPWKSSGGFGIAPWKGQSEKAPSSYYYQKRVEGESFSALFLGEADRSCRWIIATQQWLGAPCGREWAYAGSLGPWPVPDAVRRSLSRLGQILVEEVGLRGLFGIDFLTNGDEVWVIEVNPRYTASVEIAEWTQGLTLLADHAGAFGIEMTARNYCFETTLYLAKKIVFATESVRIPKWFSMKEVNPFCLPEMGDIPEPGTHCQAGDPILTVYGWGETIESTKKSLEDRIRAIEEQVRIRGDF